MPSINYRHCLYSSAIACFIQTSKFSIYLFFVAFCLWVVSVRDLLHRDVTSDNSISDLVSVPTMSNGHWMLDGWAGDLQLDGECS
jgi:hypothetical protein